MSWKKLLAGVAALCVAAGCGAGGLWWALFQSPEFYTQVLQHEQQADPVDRKAALAAKALLADAGLTEMSRPADTGGTISTASAIAANTRSR